MRILFINSTIPNYVTDGLFHGLRSISGVTVVDIPKLEYMYSDAALGDLKKTGSKGNTLYKLLPEAKEAKGRRTFWQTDVEDYDFIIFTDIFHQHDLFQSIYKSINPKKRNCISIIDGNDMTSSFPYYNNVYNLKNRPSAYLNGTNRVSNFKREYEDSASLYGIAPDKFPAINKILTKVLKKPKKLFPISMSIPEEHIQYVPFKDKVKDFVNYNLDTELNDLFPERPVAELGKWQPAFENQAEYFEEIVKCRFGITTKRAGWDCLRHYEYAAKGAILCFKDLDKKHPLCAPFDLDENNCIPYKNREDLLNKIKKKSQLELEGIQEKQYEWIQKYTTKNVASRFLDQLVLISTK